MTKPIEAAAAQELLLQLAQILVPLTEAEPPKSSPLSQHLFVPPPSNQTTAIRYPVRSLVPQIQVKEEVEHWIEEVGKLATKPQEKNQIPQRERQVESLIQQVRVAIQTLSSLPSTKESQAIREAVEKIKPALETLIQAVGRGERASTSENGLSSFAKQSLPTKTAPSEKEIRFPFAEKRGETPSLKTRGGIKVQKEEKPPLVEEESSPPFLQKEAPKGRRESPPEEREESAEKILIKKTALPKLAQTKEAIEKHKPEGRKEAAAAEVEAGSRGPIRTDRTTPSSLPFTPQPEPASRRVKKKRKSFRFRDKDEEEEDPRSSR